MSGRSSKAHRDTFDQCLHRERSKWRLCRGLPDHGIAANDRESRIPRPDRHREIEGGDDAYGTKRMPLLHHSVVWPFAGNGEAIELTRQADREVADVDHLLHLAESLGADLAGLYGDKLAKRRLEHAKLFAQEPNEFATLRCGHRAPPRKCLF